MTNVIKKIITPKKGKELSVFVSGDKNKPYAIQLKDLDDNKVEKGVKLAPVMMALRKSGGVITEGIKKSLKEEHKARVVFVSSK